MKDKLQRVNKMIETIQNELKTNSSADQKRNQRMLLNMYLKKKKELEK